MASVTTEGSDKKMDHARPYQENLDEKFAMKGEPSVEGIDLDDYNDECYDGVNDEDMSGIIDVMQIKAEEDFNVKKGTVGISFQDFRYTTKYNVTHYYNITQINVLLKAT